MEGWGEHGLPGYLDDDEDDRKRRSVKAGIDKGMFDSNSLGGTEFYFFFNCSSSANQIIQDKKIDLYKPSMQAFKHVSMQCRCKCFEYLAIMNHGHLYSQ